MSYLDNLNKDDTAKVGSILVKTKPNVNIFTVNSPEEEFYELIKKGASLEEVLKSDAQFIHPTILKKLLKKYYGV